MLANQHAIKYTEGMTKEITIAKEISPLIERAESLEITTPKDAELGNEMLSQANKALDKIEAEEQKVLRPLLDATAAERARWKPMKDQLKPIIAAMRSKLGAYQMKAEEEAAAEAEKIAARVGEGRGHLTAETAVAKIEAIDKPAATIETASGSLKFRNEPRFEVMDMSLLPMEYHLADEVAIRKAMKADTKLPGVRYYIEKVPVNSR